MARGDAGTRPTAGGAARPAPPTARRALGLCRPRAALLAGLALCGALLGGCATLRTDYPRTPSSALPPQYDTDSGRYVRAELDSHPGKTGFRLLASSTDALMSRVWLIDHARHSIDLQYFIFENDATGRLVARRLLAAADRGVRVRLLLDDISLKNENRLLGALDGHPRIEVRVFNPFYTREPSILSKALQLAVEGRRLNRRMHNKSMIVDGFVAVIGGRNIGDRYFDAGSDDNFRDLDLITIGPVVAQAATAFDEYWNSDAAYPPDAYGGRHHFRADLSALRPELSGEVRAFAQSDYARAVLEQLPAGATGDRPGQWLWGDGTLLADLPQKINSEGDERGLRIGPKVKQAIDGTRSELLLISAYFIPSRHGTRYLTALARRGAAVKVLTNSLASTDEPAAEAGYARHRRALLEGGVQLYELRPAPGGRQELTAAGHSSGISLHAKAIVVDRTFVFIGSMNLDPRSKLLNTEMGVLADCPPLAQAVAQFFEQAAAPASAFRVQLASAAGAGVDDSPPADAPRLTWSWEDHGVPMSSHRDPDVHVPRKLEFEAAKLLPIQDLL